jgi:hypothetical protein
MQRSIASPLLDWERIACAAMDPLQIAVLRQPALGEASPHQIATRLDESLGTVSYHVRRLHSFGLIELARTEPRRGAVEHFYVLSETLVRDDPLAEVVVGLARQRDLRDAGVLEQRNARTAPRHAARDRRRQRTWSLQPRRDAGRDLEAPASVGVPGLHARDPDPAPVTS